MHSNELGTFIPPLMSRAIQPITINIFFVSFFVCPAKSITTQCCAFVMWALGKQLGMLSQYEFESSHDHIPKAFNTTLSNVVERSSML